MQLVSFTAYTVWEFRKCKSFIIWNEAFTSGNSPKSICPVVLCRLQCNCICQSQFVIKYFLVLANAQPHKHDMAERRSVNVVALKWNLFLAILPVNTGITCRPSWYRLCYSSMLLPCLFYMGIPVSFTILDASKSIVSTSAVWQ